MRYAGHMATLTVPLGPAPLDEVGRLIRQARAAASLTQAELAELVGTKQSVVSRWERGHDEPRLSTLDRILRACGQAAVLHVEPDVDRAQIRQQLALSPAERLASVVNVSRMLAAARRVD